MRVKFAPEKHESRMKDVQELSKEYTGSGKPNLERFRLELKNTNTETGRKQSTRPMNEINSAKVCFQQKHKKLIA